MGGLPLKKRKRVYQCNIGALITHVYNLWARTRLFPECAHATFLIYPSKRNNINLFIFYYFVLFPAPGSTAAHVLSVQLWQVQKSFCAAQGYNGKRQQTVARPMPHLYSVRTSLPLAQKFCSFFSIPALLVVLAAGSRIAVSPTASTFVFPTCQRTNYKSTRGGLLAHRIALPELKPCAADVIETSLEAEPPAAYPAILTNRTGKRI